MNKEIIDIVDRLIEQKGGSPSDVIPLLQGIQNAFNYLPGEALVRVCEKTEITPAQPRRSRPGNAIDASHLSSVH